MSDYIPYFLREAVLSLIPATVGGTATGDAVWMGACANGIRFSSTPDELKIHPSGDRDPIIFHTGEEHGIEIDRTWLIRKANYQDFRLARNQQYRLEVVWNSEGYWYKRTYIGVTLRSIQEQSVRTNHLALTQSFRANRFSETGGQGSPETFTPFDESGQDVPVAFFFENDLVEDEYLLGHYRWPVNATILSAKAIAWASTGTDTVLELEVDGVLTGHQLTLSAGSGEVSDEDLAISQNVVAGESVRWKIVTSPAAPNAGSHAAVVMQCRAT